VEHCKMPKIKKSLSSTLNALVNVYNDFTTDGQVLLCKYCEVVVSSSKKFQVQQHIQTAKHAIKKEAKTSTKQQALLTTTLALVSADIPLNKLNNKELVSFLEKYTDQKVPSESTLRKNYVPDLYNETLDRLREKVGDNSIWVSLDETTDVDARCVANFVFGILGPEEERDKSYLLNLKVLDKVNHSPMAAFFTDSLGLLWVDGIKYDRVLLVCTDAAPYMVKCMAELEILFPKMIHVTCLAHGLHRVAELARAVMPDVNKVFLKAPSRKERFQQIAGTVPLPPSPVVTRWGTWIEAALYYADNFETVKCVVESFDPTASVHMKEAQNKKGLTLKSGMNVVQGAVDSLSHLEKKDYFENVSQVLAKNKGYNRLKKIIGIAVECSQMAVGSPGEGISHLQLDLMVAARDRQRRISHLTVHGPVAEEFVMQLQVIHRRILGYRVWKRGSVGADVLPKMLLAAALTTSSMTWCLHPSLNSCFSSSASRWTTAPWTRPVLDDVVSKHSALTFEAQLQSSIARAVARAWVRPVPSFTGKTASSFPSSWPRPEMKMACRCSSSPTTF
ncbi:CGG triplet repeat-binding protein 1-like 9, partial [Homarus americanus]